MHDLCPIINSIETAVKKHRLDNVGEYRRWLWQDEKGSRSLGVNEYGCADAANILYTIGRFPSDPAERACWVDVLQKMQKRDSGLFIESTHFPIHCTAHCIAALELFDARPLHPVKDLLRYRDPAAMRDFLDKLDWKSKPWSMSHNGTGLYVALMLTGEAGTDWQDAYFQWLWDEADPETGFWRKGCIKELDSAPLFHHLAGTFHYLFNHEYAHRPLRYPERMVDTCLSIGVRDSQFLYRGINYAEIDWIYCLSRSLRQCGHRFGECQDALKKCADRYLGILSRIDYEGHDQNWGEGWNDLHRLFGATCALAELQQALPGYLRTEHPLRLVLDRRPFI